MSNKLVLGIETSCDETSASIVENGRYIRSNIISSQIDIHQIYGGVVPEIASRKHLETISRVVDLALFGAEVGFADIDAIAVTQGPGLVGALLVGVSYAKGLAYALKKPLIGVNHIEGHIYANYLENPGYNPPFICLVVSGGHTHIMKVASHDMVEIMGRTQDDAAGEAFDKVARAIGLGYPGGPKLDALAATGDPDAFALPTAFDESGNLDFSFSGLKSAVLNLLNKAAMNGESVNKADLAASFQKTTVNVLVKKAVAACKAAGIDRLALAGGVACNSALRKAIEIEGKKNGLETNIPKPVFCTDNAAMIAARGYFSNIEQNVSTPKALDACSVADRDNPVHGETSCSINTSAQNGYERDCLYMNAWPNIDENNAFRK